MPKDDGGGRILRRALVCARKAAGPRPRPRSALAPPAGVGVECATLKTGYDWPCFVINLYSRHGCYFARAKVETYMYRPLTGLERNLMTLSLALLVAVMVSLLAR